MRTVVYTIGRVILVALAILAVLLFQALASAVDGTTSGGWLF